MASETPIIISGHVDSTIYFKDDREWISLNGKQVGVFHYRPSPSSAPINVVQRGLYYSTVSGVSTTSVYEGNDIMERISHSISAFWTQLSSIMDTVRHIPEIDMQQFQTLSDGVIGTLYACSDEITKEQSVSRTAHLQIETLDIQLIQQQQEMVACRSAADKLKKKADSCSKALNLALHPSSDQLPILHQLCLDNSCSVMDLAKISSVDIHQLAVYPFFQNLCFLPSETKFRPIHVAALSGNVGAMKELYELDSGIRRDLTGEEKLSVLELSAFSSLECFQLCKSWFSSSSRILSSHQLQNSEANRLLLMAAMGGNLEILFSFLPSPQSLSVQHHYDFWNEMMIRACIGGNSRVLDWLMTFEGATDFFSEDLCVKALSTVKREHLRLECVQWMMNRSLDFENLLTRRVFGVNIFQNWMASSCRLDVLDWLSTLPAFELATLGRNGWTLMHEACASNSVPVLEWALLHSPINEDAFHILDEQGNHLIHTAARFGSLDCLKWICDQLLDFRGVPGSNHLLSLTGHLNRTVLHFAAMSGDLKLLDWLFTSQRADFSSPRDINGLLPIHLTWRNLNALKWMITMAKCDLTVRASNGWQLLHFAIYQSKLDLVEFIVMKMGQPCLNAPIPNCGRTAAHFVSSEAMGELLLKLGANLTLCNNASQSLFDLQTSLRSWLASKGIVS